MLPVLLAIGMVPHDILISPPLPSARQLAWHKLERYCFVHFGPNTFTGNEWGSGKEPTEVFNPKDLDCRQWCRTFKAAGFKGVMITAKHHDGFCLWPSKYSTHTVAQSPWKGGKGDVLKELSTACKAEGLKFGVYLSPWDRNQPTYGTPQYNDIFKSMLREVLTHYGPVFEVWFDGANGEGPNGKRQVYDWPGFIQVVRQCQPNAVIFSDAGPDIRWVGNEDGYAGETNWNMIDRSKFEPGRADQHVLNVGDEQGPDYIPAECDVSIRPGWFWRSSEDSKVKSVEKLLDIWYGSVGRGGNLILNVPPNASGLISEVDVNRLMAFNQALNREFAHPVKVQSVLCDNANGAAFQPRQLVDGDQKTYWQPPEYHNWAGLYFSFGKQVEIDRIVIREHIALGQRIKSFSITTGRDLNHPIQLASGTTVGNMRVVRIPRTRLDQIRIGVTANGRPALDEVSFYDTRTSE